MSEIIIYNNNEGIQVDVQFEKDTVWLNRQQLALLFDRDIKTIGKHINNVFREKELEPNSVVANFATTKNSKVNCISVTEDSSVVANEGKKYTSKHI